MAGPMAEFLRTRNKIYYSPICDKKRSSRLAANMKRLRALTNTIRTRDGIQAGRYLVVILGGFVVDLAVAWSTHELLRFDLLAAATLGFILAMVLSYFAHELWTFRRTASAVSLVRFTKFVVACGATLATRLLLIWATGLIGVLSGASLVRLLVAYGGSLVVGFLLNRNTVFSEPANDDAAARPD